jgi:type I restriction-modification system DNA methylase subunit
MIKPLSPESKVGENEWNCRLRDEIKTRGFESAQFEPIISVIIDGKPTTRKPDVGFTNGGYHVISGKLGAYQELAAITSANDYKEDLSQLENFGDTFAVTYPVDDSEGFHLHVLPKAGRTASKFYTPGSIEKVAEIITDHVKGMIERAKSFEEPLHEVTPRLLRKAVTILANSIKDANPVDLETVFGGHDFFQSVLVGTLIKKKKNYLETLTEGAAFLFANQILFYILLTEAESKKRRESGESAELKYPPIKRKDAENPTALMDNYFTKINDFSPIYGINVSHFFKGAGIGPACSGITLALKDLLPRFEIRDVMGQIFQKIMPLEIRKPLGAHYTNPKAAELLAALAIRQPDVSVFDPACGSGTLLAAAYRRKWALKKPENEELTHRVFVEEQITGIDAMAFAGHLAAVNLAIQQPLFDTDFVRIAAKDSSTLEPGEKIKPTEKTISSELKQKDLMDSFDGKDKSQVKRRRIVALSGKKPIEFTLNKQDLIIMNPPFTSRDNMAASYRDHLARIFSTGLYKAASSGKKISQQVYFLLLAHKFLHQGGCMAAVLPLNTLTGKDYWPTVDFLIKNYKVKHIIVGLGYIAFSEDTSLSECLFIAEKNSVEEDSIQERKLRESANQKNRFKLTALFTAPDNWTREEIQEIVRNVEAGKSIAGSFLTLDIEQSDLLPSGPMIQELIFRLIPGYRTAAARFVEVKARSKTKLVDFNSIRTKRDITYTLCMEKARHINELGGMALFISRNESRALKKIDRLVLSEVDGRLIRFTDKVTKEEFVVPRTDVKPACRRLTGLSTLDVSDDFDFCISALNEDAERIFTHFYNKKDGTVLISKLKSHRFWEDLVNQNAAKIIIAKKINFTAPGTGLICCWANEPMFLSSPNYRVFGFSDDREEALFCLWVNSSIGLYQVIANTASTGLGVWARIERYTMDRVWFPDYSSITEWDRVAEIWKRISKMKFPSLIEQLKGKDEFRNELDDSMLSLLGFSDLAEREAIAQDIRKGLLELLVILKSAMKKPGKSKAADDSIAEDELTEPAGEDDERDTDEPEAEGEDSDR